MQAHRRRLAHAEMIQAQTTASIINYSLSPPEHPVKPADLCFNYKPPVPVEKPKGPVITEDILIDWQARVANLAAELKQGHGPMLDEIKRQSNG
jgi:hypothetical protein